MSDGVICDGEFTKVVTNHIGLDFNLDVVQTVVHTNNRGNHLGYDDVVTKVGLNGLRLLVDFSVLLRLSQSAHQMGGHGVGLDDTR